MRFWAPLAVAAFAALWSIAVVELSRASDEALSSDCDGCGPWVQGPLDLDQSSWASTSLVLDVGRGCPAELVLDVHVDAAGECGPGVGTSCTEALAPCTAAGTLTFRAPLGVRLFLNDGTYGPGITWIELPQTACIPAVEQRRFARVCGHTSFVWILAWDTVSGATAFNFLTIGCASCPLPD